MIKYSFCTHKRLLKHPGQFIAKGYVHSLMLFYIFNGSSTMNTSFKLTIYTRRLTGRRFDNFQPNRNRPEDNDGLMNRSHSRSRLRDVRDVASDFASHDQRSNM